MDGSICKERNGLSSTAGLCVFIWRQETTCSIVLVELKKTCVLEYESIQLDRRVCLLPECAGNEQNTSFVHLEML